MTERADQQAHRSLIPARMTPYPLAGGENHCMTGAQKKGMPPPCPCRCQDQVRTRNRACLMGGNLYPELTRLLREAGCSFVRQAKGSHEIGGSCLQRGISGERAVGGDQHVRQQRFAAKARDVDLAPFVRRRRDAPFSSWPGLSRPSTSSFNYTSQDYPGKCIFFERRWEIFMVTCILTTWMAGTSPAMTRRSIRLFRCVAAERPPPEGGVPVCRQRKIRHCLAKIPKLFYLCSLDPSRRRRPNVVRRRNRSARPLPIGRGAARGAPGEG